MHVCRPTQKFLGFRNEVWGILLPIRPSLVAFEPTGQFENSVTEQKANILSLCVFHGNWWLTRSRHLLVPLLGEELGYFCPCLLNLVGASWPVNTSTGRPLSSSVAPDWPWSTLPFWCAVKWRKAQELETAKSGLGDADENVAGDNTQETELPSSHCLWNKIFLVIFFPLQ